MAYSFTKKQVRDAVEECNGTYTDVARKLKCRSSLTSKKFVHKYPDLLEIFEKKREELCDIAEDSLMYCLTRCNTDNTRLAAARFVLERCSERWKDNGVSSEEKLIDLVDKLIDNAEK